ncbi:MAG TPA: ABC transporter substrate-binding protein [Candidatus Limnocylindria bacterium]|nr:ABC transporter substrate-binding protein [Candidatus Limnocylindria bacterium]
MRLLASVLLVGTLLGGCSLAAPPTQAPATPLTVGLGFIPSVQFAQFYRADRQGYYEQAGLDVTFQHGIDPELITLIGQGAVDVGMGDGTSLIPAASQGIPVRYVASVYARFPSVVIARADSGIATPADLEGRTLGIPGRFGSSWVMLQALLASAGLTPDDLDVRLYPDFGQAVALREGQVEAATGFANNEPVQLARAGFQTTVLRVDEITPLPGPGLTVGEATLRDKEDALRLFVAATLRAMEEIIADPELGLEDAVAAVPELGEDREGQLAVLEATVEMWQSPYTEANGLGAIDTEAWQESIEFMRDLPESVVSPELMAEQLVTEELLP